MFAGTHTAIITPFRNGRLDEDALKKVIDYQFDGGVQGVVPCGTTGESPTLDYDEHDRVIQLTVGITRGRGLVIAGTGSNSTREAIEMTQEAEAAGANASLQVAPYYNKPTQEGLFRHFRDIAKNTSLPIMLYSIPGRCGIEIGIETVVRLAEECPNIRAIKEAGGNADRVSVLKQLLPENFEILSGDDSLTLPFMSVGGKGIVSVAGNLIPKEMSTMVQHALKGEWAEAQAIHAKFNPLFSMFLKLATNPIPIKTAMALKGLCDAELRLPMCEMSDAQVAELKATMVKLGIL
ncbi:4-hydroxy-tetrahydrodipicolinate synthase [Roseimicrobium sp. ORNL1]|uniref:4-hydroxy-tetrahydrodipicolinate synthase n=1 Tax=Roseimicrobium sp. ORNL1 TaxID=2711231 RepID=UPI0013E200D0|nr:4-hydroxy-tetrahydrodipicolinate synthase [Roseimicrobium sp. ORNL1]QIF03478.1 4-hydroxy-tetrahydrodipicolinate synthase [Roseimicrobium sp. ORNL1]